MPMVSDIRIAYEWVEWYTSLILIVRAINGIRINTTNNIIISIISIISINIKVISINTNIHSSAWCGNINEYSDLGWCIDTNISPSNFISMYANIGSSYALGLTTVLIIIGTPVSKHIITAVISSIMWWVDIIEIININRIIKHA